MSTLLRSYSQVFLVFFSSGSNSVLHSKFLCYVPGSSSRIAQCMHSTSQLHALLPWRRPVEANHLVSLGCSLCGGLFIAHSSWSLERENARNYETKTSSSYFDVEWFPGSLCSWTNIRARRSMSARSETAPHSTQIFPNPHLSVQLWVGKLLKSCQHFLNLLVKEKQLWQVNVLSPRMPLYGTLYLCLEPVLPVAMRFHTSHSAVTSALASPIAPHVPPKALSILTILVFINSQLQSTIRTCPFWLYSCS